MTPWPTQAELAGRLGVVVPAFFSSKPSDEMVRRLLWMTLADAHHYSALDTVCVVVDGDARTATLAAELRDALRREHGRTFHLLALPENRGKLYALAQGMGWLLEQRPHLHYLAVRDGDGDHQPAALPSMARAAHALVEAYGHERVLVIGARPSRHRPMGLVRGELEALLDACTLDALAYHAARRGTALDLSRCVCEPPDISSGYKLYGRELARSLFSGAEQLCGLRPEEYWRYGPETVTVVEALLEGAVMAEVRRLTWDGQPTSSFGEFRHQALYGALLAWVWVRLEIPLAVAARHVDNHAAGLLLRTAPEGREVLAALRAAALERLAAATGQAGPLPSTGEPLPYL